METRDSLWIRERHMKKTASKSRPLSQRYVQLWVIWPAICPTFAEPFASFLPSYVLKESKITGQIAVERPMEIAWKVSQSLRERPMESLECQGKSFEIARPQALKAKGYPFESVFESLLPLGSYSLLYSYHVYLSLSHMWPRGIEAVIHLPLQITSNSLLMHLYHLQITFNALTNHLQTRTCIFRILFHIFLYLFWFVICDAVIWVIWCGKIFKYQRPSVNESLISDLIGIHIWKYN